MQNMTPQEISEYKNNWLPGTAVRLHSDLDVQGKDWCRKHIERHQWSMKTFTDVYEHTFHFESPTDAEEFCTAFPEQFINQ